MINYRRHYATKRRRTQWIKLIIKSFIVRLIPHNVGNVLRLPLAMHSHKHGVINLTTTAKESTSIEIVENVNCRAIKLVDD